MNYWLINKKFWKHIFKVDIIGSLKGLKNIGEKSKLWMHFFALMLLLYIIKGFFSETKSWISLSIWVLLVISYLWYVSQIGDWKRSDGK